jgi:hypothetical protein
VSSSSVSCAASHIELDPVLDALADVLLYLWNRYQPICASSIVLAMSQFVTYSRIELELNRLPLIHNAQRFTWFVHDRIGISEPHAVMAYTITRKLDIIPYQT